MSHESRKARKKMNRLFPELKEPYMHPTKLPTPIGQRRSRPQGSGQKVWRDRLTQLLSEASVEKPKRKRKTRSQKLAEEQAALTG